MNEELIKMILAFREERNWEQFHNPKDLAISLSLEASELLENFQWKTSAEAVLHKKADIADELADVLVYAVYLADALNLDIEDIIRSKMRQNAAKYPVDKAYGKREKYTEL
ncbi:MULTISPECIES: nucleotide pyrophosphohydrolase [Paenibacillus]|uniref:nucleotide pyrophosphohydrolase n=1 Tax=Paenibacillus TaxID=44249 RepID=UPI001F0F6F20|nr:nucleotide pyrophosphohydrolase [Paenibacillus macerans]MBS5909566.1 nucleotide pyrophosphohydrolase [Paenibacillus macerans]UMV48603.1 nucleotide pyrophosphohydrolase [Paenibacillus macerans]